MIGAAAFSLLSHQLFSDSGLVYDQVTTYLRPKNVGIVANRRKDARLVA